MMRFIIVVLTVALAAACSDNGDSGQPTDGGLTPIDVSLGDEMSDGTLVSLISPDEFTVRAGQEVTFNLSNDGTVPHNMRNAGTDDVYNTEDDFLVGPEILFPGDTAIVKWTIPSEAGKLVFRCDFHLNTATITVQ